MLIMASGRSDVPFAAVPAGPGKPLPEGFFFHKVYSEAKPQGYAEYVATCPLHEGQKRLDRWGSVVDYFDMHAGCR